MDARYLEGQVALVTGAGRGLGRAFAELLARLGANVAVHGMREEGPAEYGEGTTLTATAEAIAAAHGVRTRRVLGDLTRSDEVARVLRETVAALGPVDILVHNAGGDIAAAGGKPDPNDCVFIREEDVRAVLDRRRGRIVTLSSVAAFKGRDRSAIYATSKAAVVHYTRCLAEQMRPFEVTVNSIAPGDTRTGRFVGTRPVDPRRMATGGTLDRIATVDEVARTLEFFVGPMGAFVTGQAMRVDGGTQLWPG
jgi:3-oxoacyl-[acyl-carrier protein] reductase